MSENSSQHPVRVLFVDDDTAFLELIAEVFTELGRGAWRIATAPGATPALERLRAEPFDLVVLDVQMPETTGLELLPLINREFPELQKAFMTSLSDAESRIEGLSGGAELFLEKPAGLDGMRSIFATLDELVRWKRKQGARGMSPEVGLKEIVKLECLAGNSRIVEVQGEKERGTIFIEGGRIVHARADFRKGQTAFSHLLCLTHPEYLLKSFQEPSDRTIDRQWEFLLMEAAQLREQRVAAESARERSGHTEPLAKTETRAPAPVAPPPESGEAGSLKLKPTREPVPRPETINHVADIYSAASAQMRPSAARPTRSPVALPTTPDGHAIGIEEFLLATTGREVLHEFKVARVEDRLDLLAGLRHDADVISRELPLGGCERFDARAARTRLLVRFDEDRNAMVRSTLATGEPRAAEAAGRPAVTDWFPTIDPPPGTRALVMGEPAGGVAARSFSADFAEAVLERAWPACGGLFKRLHDRRLPAWKFSLLFEHLLLTGVHRTDGRVMVAFLDRDAAATGSTGLDACFDAFRTLPAD